MNGKLARALRRHNPSNQLASSALDQARAKRHFDHLYLVRQKQPKPGRKRTGHQHQLHTPIYPDMAGTIAVKPVRLLKIKSRFVGAGKATGYVVNSWREAASLPKHILNTLALRS